MREPSIPFYLWILRCRRRFLSLIGACNCTPNARDHREFLVHAGGFWEGAHNPLTSRGEVRKIKKLDRLLRVEPARPPSVEVADARGALMGGDQGTFSHG